MARRAAGRSAADHAVRAVSFGRADGGGGLISQPDAHLPPAAAAP